MERMMPTEATGIPAQRISTYRTGTHPRPRTTPCDEPLLGTVTPLRSPRGTALPSHPLPSHTGSRGAGPPFQAQRPEPCPETPPWDTEHKPADERGTPNLGKTPPAPASPPHSLFRGTRQTGTAATQTRRCAFPAAAPPPTSRSPSLPSGPIGTEKPRCTHTHVTHGRVSRCCQTAAAMPLSRGTPG